MTVPFFGRPHLVTHPDGEVSAGGAPVHVAVGILLLHYLLRADGTPPAGEWRAFRELPDGLFYAASFAERAEAPLTQGVRRRRRAGGADGRRPRPPAAGRSSWPTRRTPSRLCRVSRLAVLVWAGDDEFPAQASMVFDAAAGHYLPAEDLAGLGGLLARRLIGGRADDGPRRPAPMRRREPRGHARWPPAGPPARRCRS